VPAKVIKYRFSDDKIQLMQSLKWWDWEPDKILHEYKRLKDFDFSLLR
jgi:chloramphenicol O-acetyltransferase type B